MRILFKVLRFCFIGLILSLWAIPEIFYLALLSKSKQTSYVGTYLVKHFGSALANFETVLKTKKNG